MPLKLVQQVFYFGLPCYVNVFAAGRVAGLA